jgi:predicted transcriptional regulator
MRYRNKTEIAAEILQTCSGGTTKTKIMYRAFLSYAQLMEYMMVLLENDLITHDAQTRMYRTTDKGHRFIQLYNRLAELTVEQDSVQS